MADLGPGGSPVLIRDPISAVIPSLEGQIFRVLAHVDGGLTGSRIAGLVRQGSPAGTRHALVRLEAGGLLRTRRVGSAVVYEPETEHLLWPAIATLVESTDTFLERLQASIESLVIGLLAPAAPEAHPSIGFFGSVARRDDTAESDVDLVLVVSDDDEERLPHVLEELTDAVIRWTGNDCAVLDLTRSQLHRMVRAQDPLMGSLAAEARTFSGPDLHEMIRRAGWLA